MQEITTINGELMPSEAFNNYLDRLTGRFFKILPLKEEGCGTLDAYIRKLQAELIGTNSLIPMLCNDGRILSLVSILQYLIDNDCSVNETRVEVFEALNICKQLQDKYGGDDNE